MAPSPVFVGYSLVGVYPCAVWKPNSNSTSTTTPATTAAGPIRNRTTTRPAPYQQRPVQQVTVNQPVVPQVPVVQNNPVVVTTCVCNKTPNKPNNNIEAPSTSNNTQMLFVPFTVPSFAPPITANTLQTNNCSPSKVGSTAWVLPAWLKLEIEWACSFTKSKHAPWNFTPLGVSIFVFLKVHRLPNRPKQRCFPLSLNDIITCWANRCVPCTSTNRVAPYQQQRNAGMQARMWVNKSSVVQSVNQGCS